ncbi:YbaB/EbfC family nucleoid-associated protein [Bacillus sp. 37MA]|uniref:Nucleoid-associated protein AWH48_20300 n=1 Tax=Domibacillus aminovorans TaxID=29332 RepID=A0A177KP26_9BACI|nr:YbaB/EbfC family nucleoid-associated protein [Bacillus sp. 37MA]OAH55119.1 nucleoid-associated protein [Domibacillus aminovorans]
MRGGNMQNMMKQMQKMQKQMQEAQEELAEKKFEGSSGGGMVKISISGQKEIVDVQIKEEVVDPEDIDMLQDLILAAVNDALKKVDNETNQRMGQFTKGMNLPF